MIYWYYQLGDECIMKYVHQFSIIIFLSFLGELLHGILPFPIPASVYGLILLFIALCTGIIKLAQVKETANFLIEIMPIMFLPAATGLFDAWPILRSICIPILLITILTTIIVMAATGQITQYMIRKTKPQKRNS